MSITQPIAFIVSILLAIPGYGQFDNNLDEKYTPNSNSIFNSSPDKTAHKSSGSDLKNLVKFSPTFLLRQKVVGFYERAIIDGLALHLGIGKAFGDDKLQSLAISEFGLFSETDYTNEYLSPGNILDYSEYSGSSIFLSIGPKFYFSGTCFEDSYFEFYYRFEEMRYLLQSTVNSAPVAGSRNVSFRMNAFGFGYGFNGLMGKNENITHDFFMQFGLKLFEYTQYRKEDNSSSPSNSLYRNTGKTNPLKLFPAVNLGYSLGFGF